MSDQQLVKLFQLIHDLAALPYPFPDGAAGDPYLRFSLGEIVGTASRALSDRRAREAASGSSAGQ